MTTNLHVPTAPVVEALAQAIAWLEAMRDTSDYAVRGAMIDAQPPGVGLNALKAALDDARGWAQRSVGCYWTHPAFPSAVVATSTRYAPGGVKQSGYVATVNFAELGLFATRELAQRAVEAYLGVE